MSVSARCAGGRRSVALSGSRVRGEAAARNRAGLLRLLSIEMTRVARRRGITP